MTTSLSLGYAFGGKRFGTIVADPPWPSRSNPGKRNKWLGANMNPRYQTMSQRDLIELPVGDIAADDAVLVLWSTWMHLDLALTAMDAWGFKYATGMPWLKVTKGSLSRDDSAEFREYVKPIFGPGVWFQHCTELILIGRQGSPFGKLGNPRPARKGIIIATRGEHSQKPEELQDWIDQNSFPDPKLELFARRPRDGWTIWGDGQ